MSKTRLEKQKEAGIWQSCLKLHENCKKQPKITKKLQKLTILDEIADNFQKLARNTTSFPL